MINHYTIVLADLRAKHAAMGELIAALENVSRLGASAIPLIEVPAVEVVLTKFSTDRTPSELATPAAVQPPRQQRTGRDEELVRLVTKQTGERDAELARIIAKHPGLTASAIARRFDPKEQNVDKLVARLLHHLKRLVADGRLARHGMSYYQPGTPAPKEAP